MSGNGCVFFPLRVCRRLGVYFFFFGSGVIGVIGVQSNSEPELRGIVTLLWMVSRERMEVHGYSRCLPSPLFLSPYICVLNPSHESNLGAGVTAHGSAATASIDFLNKHKTDSIYYQSVSLIKHDFHSSSEGVASGSNLLLKMSEMVLFLWMPTYLRYFP